MILMYKSIDLLERNVFGMDSIKVDAVCARASASRKYTR